VGVIKSLQTLIESRAKRAELDVIERQQNLSNQETETKLSFEERQSALENQRQRREVRSSQIKLARRQADAMLSSWEGAETDRLRGDKWMSSKLSTNDAVEKDLENLSDRAEELYKNDCYASSAINGRVDNVIGKGIGYQSRVVAVRGLITESRAKEINEQKEAVFKKWAKQERLRHKQKMAERCKAIYGESLVVMSQVKDRGRAIPLHLQVISPRRLETPPKYEGDPNVRLGIRFKPGTREPVTYYIRKADPRDSKEFSFEYDEVAAWRVCHDFDETLPGQIRGVPWLAPVMNKLKDIKDFAEAHLISEQIAACFSAFITTEDDDNEGAADERSYATDAYGNRLETLEPATLNYLGRNQKVQFGDPNRPSGTLEPFLNAHLHAIAAGLRYPYELLVKMYDNSYSGGRLSLIDGHNTFRCWQEDCIESTWQKVSDRFTDECVIHGLIDVDSDEYLENRSAFRQDKWLPQGWPWIAPKDDVQATVDAREAGLTTDTESLSLHGRDFEETQQTILREELTKIENAAKLEKRRRELAAEIGDDNFGKSEEQLKAQKPEVANEPVNA